MPSAPPKPRFSPYLQPGPVHAGRQFHTAAVRHHQHFIGVDLQGGVREVVKPSPQPPYPCPGPPRPLTFCSNMLGRELPLSMRPRWPFWGGQRLTSAVTPPCPQSAALSLPNQSQGDGLQLGGAAHPPSHLQLITEVSPVSPPCTSPSRWVSAPAARQALTCRPGKERGAGLSPGDPPAVLPQVMTSPERWFSTLCLAQA